MISCSRRDPRRQHFISAAGLRRIVLGTTAAFAPSLSTLPIEPGIIASSLETKPLRTTEVALRSVLVIVHSERGILDEHARQALATAALIADGQTAVITVVLGELNEDLAQFGADRVLILRDCDARHFRPEHTLERIAALIQRYRPLRVILPDRAGGEGDIGRRLAAASGLSIATSVVELSDHGLAVRYGNSKRLARRSLTDIVLLAPDAVEADLPFVGHGEMVEPEPVVIRASAYRNGDIVSTAAGRLPLEEARFIAAAGNGVTDVALFERLAGALGATIGASRVAVDDGRFARDKQIGATGKTVAAEVYLAIGISGAVQHLQGIKDCRHVIAVNRDIAAPIAQRANLTIIDDAQALMSALHAAIHAARPLSITTDRNVQHE